MVRGECCSVSVRAPLLLTSQGKQAKIAVLFDSNWKSGKFDQDVDLYVIPQPHPSQSDHMTEMIIEVKAGPLTNCYQEIKLYLSS